MEPEISGLPSPTDIRGGATMRAITRGVFVSFAFIVATLPARLMSQGVTVQSVTDVRFQGALGTMMNLASKFGGGGNMHDLPTTTYISGHKLRTESGNTASIIDADAGRLIGIDHKQKSYTSLTFDQMADAMRQAEQSQKEAAAKQAGTPKSTKASDTPKGDVNFKYHVDVDRPGQHENIAGYSSERMFMTITIEGEATPEGQKTEQVGSLVFLLDQWIAKDAPQAKAMAEFQRAYAQKVGKAFAEQKQSLQAAFNSDPRIKVGFEAAAKEMAKVEGTPLRSVIYVTLVPAGMQFDRKLALNDVAAGEKADKAASSDDKPKSGGFGGLIGKVKAAAEQANKQGDNKSSDAPPKQATLMTMKDEVRSISLGAVGADMFAPPAGYRQSNR
jgi:hypothetical protein